MKRRWQLFGIIVFIIALGIVAAGCALRGEQITPRPAPTDTPVEPTDKPAEPTDTPLRPLTEATVAVAPPSGPPGSEIQVTAAGFPPQTEIELGVAQQGAASDLLITDSTGPDGALTTTLAIPNTAEPDEAWVVVARTEDGGSEVLSNVFQVSVPQYEAAASIAPVSGSPGTEVQVTAEGLPPNAPVQIGVGREDSEYDVVDAVQTESDGSITTSVTIPDSAEPGERWVVVVVAQDRPVEAVSNVFQVGQAQYQGAVAISPRSGPPGTIVDVVAREFPPNAPVVIGIGRVDSEYDVVTTVQTDASGRVETQIQIPAFVEPEDRWVIVVAAEGRPVKAVSDPFDVTQAMTATPRGNLFTRTNIYLIAVGDDGQSGKEIGCDDSVIPVEVAIEPTIAPLTAALQKLLAIETREYGQSGLYNALYQSDLALEDVSIEGREAVIRLSGTLTLGGVCDEPRVQAQLRETALQYATVDQVSIFVNGTSLDQLLGAATPTPSGDLFTRTNIYLIAVGDDGQSGREIGCDDSVIPVEVPIEPTIAPLTAALNELLAIETREYGQSGLYNALYQSDLALEDVSIEGREAVIRLSGTLTLGGVCDEPRVRAQLRETALQYATVDQVSIFVNGTPLDQLLDQRG